MTRVRFDSYLYEDDTITIHFTDEQGNKYDRHFEDEPSNSALIDLILNGRDLDEALNNALGGTFDVELWV